MASTKPMGFRAPIRALKSAQMMNSATSSAIRCASGACGQLLRAAVAGQEASISHVRLVCRVYSNLGLTLCSGHAGFDTESTSAVIGLQCPVDAGSPTWLHHFSSARFPPPPNQRVLFADFPTIVQASPMYRRSDMPNEACSTVLAHMRR